MKIYAPVKDANGVYASVMFVNGVGETDNPGLIEWFRQHGYMLENCEVCNENCIENNTKPSETAENSDFTEIQTEKAVKIDFESRTPNDLREWMRSHGYGAKIKNTKNKDKLIEILRG